MRLFIGIEIPEDIKEHIYNHVLPIQQSKKGWENAHDYHQTLLFIGETQEEDIVEIRNRLKLFSSESFKLKSNGFKFFNRRVMYLGFEPSNEIVDLRKKLEASFPAWVRVETKPYIPHVTVKRWQRYEYEHLSNGLNSREFKDIELRVNRLALFKSEKDSLNNKYHVIDYSSEFF
jgi:2'-5' RNA ligase